MHLLAASTQASSQFWLFVFLGCVIYIGIFGFTKLGKEAGEIHDQLRAFKAEAEKAGNAELYTIRKKLVEFHNTRCWHRKLGEHAREVLAYIDNRIAQ